MAISTYGEFKTAIATWLNRTDLTDNLGDIVTMAEASIRRDVRIRAMQQTASGTLSAATLALPTRFAEARRVLLADVVQQYVTPDQWYSRRNNADEQYTIVGETFHFQSTSATYQIDYWQWFAAFSGTSDTNTLLTNYPDVYLFAGLAAAMDLLQGDSSKWEAKYRAAVARVHAAENKMAGPLVVRPDIRVA